MDGDVAGVRIIPPLVEFKDCDINTLREVHITVKNVSKTSKNIRYYGPQTKVLSQFVSFLYESISKDKEDINQYNSIYHKSFVQNLS